MVEPFGFIARFDAADLYYELEYTFDAMDDVVEIPLKGCCDVSVHEESPSIGFNNILPDFLDHSHVFPICSQTFFFVRVLL